uniref:Uncharacterized protein n=1 Tax=Anguilla anguilla TaxID=7936 RepID=A0A0E9QN83_ANGAN
MLANLVLRSHLVYHTVLNILREDEFILRLFECQCCTL